MRTQVSCPRCRQPINRQVPRRTAGRALAKTGGDILQGIGVLATVVALRRNRTAPIAAWLVSRGDGSLWLVSSYAVVVAAISLVSARLLPETVGRDLDEAWKEAPVSKARVPQPVGG